MSVNEELSEGTEHAKEPFDKRVAASMAIIAALLAIVSVAGHILSTDELLEQQKASDQWAYYQAKSIRRYESDIAKDILKASDPKGSEHYGSNAERYEKDGEEIQSEAKALETESRTNGRKALRLEISEVFLEIGIVFASLAILTKRPLIWFTSIGSATVGIVIASTTALIH
jgi:hypothetical protein